MFRRMGKATLYELVRSCLNVRCAQLEQLQLCFDIGPRIHNTHLKPLEDKRAKYYVVPSMWQVSFLGDGMYIQRFKVLFWLYPRA